MIIADLNYEIMMAESLEKAAIKCGRKIQRQNEPYVYSGDRAPLHQLLNSKAKRNRTKL